MIRARIHAFAQHVGTNPTLLDNFLLEREPRTFKKAGGKMVVELEDLKLPQPLPMEPLLLLALQEK